MYLLDGEGFASCDILICSELHVTYLCTSTWLGRKKLESHLVQTIWLIQDSHINPMQFIWDNSDKNWWRYEEGNRYLLDLRAEKQEFHVFSQYTHREILGSLERLYFCQFIWTYTRKSVHFDKVTLWCLSKPWELRAMEVRRALQLVSSFHRAWKNQEKYDLTSMRLGIYWNDASNVIKEAQQLEFMSSILEMTILCWDLICKYYLYSTIDWIIILTT